MSYPQRSTSRKFVSNDKASAKYLTSLTTERSDSTVITKKSRRVNSKASTETHVLGGSVESSRIPSISVTKMAKKRTRLDSSSSTNSNSRKKNDTGCSNDEDFCEDEDIIEISSPKKNSSERKEVDRCVICLDECVDPKVLDKCSHIFCKVCIDYYFETVKPQCPCCFTIYGEIRGNQPVNGTMTIDLSKHRLPGFEHDSRGTIRINYHFPHGIQDESHPNPGKPYYGTTRQAYLPDNRDGRHVLGMLQKAFALRQIFTIGQSRTTGYDNVITWNDIHHKTNIYGGVEHFGYPDTTYLNRVIQELAAKGIK